MQPRGTCWPGENCARPLASCSAMKATIDSTLHACSFWSTPKLPTMSLAEVVEMDPAPINGVNVIGRVVMLFGSQVRYPAFKMVVVKGGRSR